MYGFGTNDPIVRIRCRVDAILECARHVAVTTDASLFVGNVTYRNENTLRGLAQSVANRSHRDVSATASALLLQKRNAFRFEHEVRFLWMDREGIQGEKFVPIEPRSVITEVLTTPHATLAQHTRIAKEFARYGVTAIRSAILRDPRIPVPTRVA